MNSNLRMPQWTIVNAICLAAVLVFGSEIARAQDDVADIPSMRLKAGGDEHKEYFLIGDPSKDRMPKSGFGLLVVLPGGDGSADFHPFVKRIFKFALPDEYLVAQPVAVKWTDSQRIVWPTKKSSVEG